jgi:hypothetical protein
MPPSCQQVCQNEVVAVFELVSHDVANRNHVPSDCSEKVTAQNSGEAVVLF